MPTQLKVSQSRDRSAQLSARLGQVNKGISAGEGDILALMEEREDATRRIQAVRVMESKKTDEDFRANIKARSAEFRTRLLPCAEQIADLVPRLLWYAEYLERLETESANVPNSGFDETGIPYGFAAQLRTAIAQLSSGIEWHFDFVSDANKKIPLPLVKNTVIDLGRAFPPTDINGRIIGSTTYL